MNTEPSVTAKNGGSPGADDAPSFVTVAGRTIGVQPVSDTLVTQALALIEKKYRDRGEPLDPPTYTVELVGGATQELPHDETTLDVADPEKTAANHAAWATHKDAKRRLADEQSRRRTYLWLMSGLKFDMPDDGWAEEQELLFGIEVPTETLARKWHYIQTVILTTAEDLMRALQAITLVSYAGMISKEEVAAQIASFRDTLHAGGRAPERGARGPEDPEGAMAVQPTA